MDSNFQAVLQKAAGQQPLSKEDIVTLLKAKPGNQQRELFALADKVRQQHHGNVVHLRGIIEFSNYCRNDCHYCGLRRSNRNISRYRMTVQQVIEASRRAIELGYNTIVLQSGEDPWYDVNTLCRMIAEIKKIKNVAITLSIGERSKEEYQQLYRAGADRFLLKHETADRQLFSSLRPGTSFERRLQCLQWLRESGYQLGSGNMVGLPGQTLDSLAEDILLLKKLDVEMAGIGPFIPHPQTPLAGQPAGDLQLALKTLAVARIMLPLCHLPATTAAGTMHSEGRQMALNCGANVIMPNVTPLKYRRLYQIYPNKAGVTDDPQQSLQKIVGIIHQVGREVAAGRGDSPKPVFQKGY
ncbi:biotin synthase [Desulfohalotomaculum tongense]|uniref:[FeFe] hydrogenase H-cluster radical SAM maturase HydE n=1 Tax=Desulforadius tongensis TaxID=1216062 RepID=UPI00195B11E9|nr:[FeFe] hydrogenase H-cluster radical SAM maturase HydE [Desulforadius tongensis]MBM7855560.1 biotin synthase [Desulforadius tongensis]